MRRDATGQSFDTYRDLYLARHENKVTNDLSTVARALPAAGIVVAALRRDYRWLGLGVGASIVLASVAHLFQPGTLRAEYAAILRHPIWAARAERELMFRRGTRTQSR